MRKLTLKKEPVTELSPAELGGVAGGALPYPESQKICLPTYDACFTTHGCG